MHPRVVRAHVLTIRRLRMRAPIVVDHALEYRSLARALDLRQTSAAERRARGIALLLRSRARRSDRGYGNFSAASAVP